MASPTPLDRTASAAKGATGYPSTTHAGNEAEHFWYDGSDVPPDETICAHERDDFALGPMGGKELTLSIVVAGASGDLAKKKTYPALYALFAKGFLPQRVQIVGYARTQLTSEELRVRLREYLPKDEEGVGQFLNNCSYLSGEYDADPGFERLAAALAKWESDMGSLQSRCADGSCRVVGRLFYLALPPSAYPQVCEKLKKHCADIRITSQVSNGAAAAAAAAAANGAAGPPALLPAASLARFVGPQVPGGQGRPVSPAPAVNAHGGQHGVPQHQPQNWVRIILEKPFGHDLSSSEALAAHIGASWGEEHLYRIDHYLGKELVQNMLLLRFANTMFGAFWHRNYISSVQITFKEPFGTEGRGGYFDSYGIVRDVIQNHLIQVLALLTMEGPVSLHPDDIRDEKVKVLRCIPPVQVTDCVLGQYTAGQGQPGYLEDPTVPAGSRTPTFAAVRLHIRNDRWEGVPIIIKAGKALNERLAAVRIQMRTPAASIFGPLDTMRNELVIRFQPGEAIYTKMVVKKPGLDLDYEMSELDLTYPERYKGVVIPDAYERLILDCIRGDQQHFVRRDELRAAWAIFTPLLHAVEGGQVPVHTYPYGSRGPTIVDQFISDSGYVKTNYAWHSPDAHVHEHKSQSRLKLPPQGAAAAAPAVGTPVAAAAGKL